MSALVVFVYNKIHPKWGDSTNLYFTFTGVQPHVLRRGYHGWLHFLVLYDHLPPSRDRE